MLMKKKFRDWNKICKEFMTNDKQETLDSHCSPEKMLQPINTFAQGYNYTTELTKKKLISFLRNVLFLFVTFESTPHKNALRLVWLKFAHRF